MEHIVEKLKKQIVDFSPKERSEKIGVVVSAADGIAAWLPLGLVSVQTLVWLSQNDRRRPALSGLRHQILAGLLVEELLHGHGTPGNRNRGDRASSGLGRAG